MFRDFAAAVEAQDPTAMAHAGLDAIKYSAVPPAIDGTAGITFIGLVMAICQGEDLDFILERVACGWFRWNDGNITTEQSEQQVRGWLTQQAETLFEYGIKVESTVALSIGAELADQFVAQIAPGTIAEQTFKLYDDGNIDRAAAYLHTVVTSLERAYAEHQDAFVKYALEDAQIRMAFMAALIGRAGPAESALRRAAALGDAQHVLQKYNAAYVRALRREYSAAAGLTRQSLELMDESPLESGVMLMYIEPPAAWIPPGPAWNTVYVKGERVHRLIEAQAIVYDALSGRYSEDEFLSVASKLAESGASEIQRLMAWTLLTRFGKPLQAVEFMGRATHLAATENDPQTTPIVDAEHTFMEGLASSDNGAGLGVPLRVET